jgi:hypothetical protein
MRDTFFDKKTCDRCPNSLESRTMSWFTEETICMECSQKEREIRIKLPNHGRDLEGCGYVPRVED